MVAFHLPNRMYYPNLHYTTQEQLTKTACHVMIYAALELLSLVVLSFILQRKLRISTTHHLAFVLEKNWKGIQSRLIFWVVYTVQGSLVHFGTTPAELELVCVSLFILNLLCDIGADFTFKFTWLHSSS